jgi:hypothetical protein
LLLLAAACCCLLLLAAACCCLLLLAAACCCLLLLAAACCCLLLLHTMLLWLSPSPAYPSLIVDVLSDVTLRKEYDETFGSGYRIEEVHKQARGAR